MMKLVRKSMILSVILSLGILPSCANLDGSVSRNLFYDTDKTIMTEIVPNKTIKTGKYWEKNLLHPGKYKPLFMLSNKELYDLMPRGQASVVQRIVTPSVYNISLKSSAIKKVSFNQSLVPKNVSQSQLLSVPATTVEAKTKVTSIYEAAKNPQVEPEQKIEAVMKLKDTKSVSGRLLAIDLLDDVIRKEPYNAYAYYLKGELYSAQGDSENAMKNYIEALKINPTSKQCCLGIAKILEPTNKDLAQKYYDKAR